MHFVPSWRCFALLFLERMSVRNWCHATTTVHAYCLRTNDSRRSVVLKMLLAKSEEEKKSTYIARLYFKNGKNVQKQMYVCVCTSGFEMAKINVL